MEKTVSFNGLNIDGARERILEFFLLLAWLASYESRAIQTFQALSVRSWTSSPTCEPIVQ